jgi:hypothetical protein
MFLFQKKAPPLKTRADFEREFLAKIDAAISEAVAGRVDLRNGATGLEGRAQIYIAQSSDNVRF